MIDLILILVLGGIALFLNVKNDVLNQQNKNLRDRIEFDKKWYEMDKKTSVNLARAEERLKISRERYMKFCEGGERVDG
ncbi:hypothetical protein [Clostridium sp. C2-6-12]|uniref:hypothetical protein n=1 Tax=Clostridium sp. C2-6-12 TaxID=2698832 RepID=UPI00136ED32A|nr:hypothetical protein [Clostridium sp. C2-6-12]